MPSRKKDRGKQRKARQKDSRQSDNEAPINAISEAHAPAQQSEETIRQLKSEGCRIMKKDDGSTLILHPNAHPGADERAFANRELLSDKQKQVLAENYVYNYAQDLREGDSHGTDIIMRNIADPHIGRKLEDELVKADIHLTFLHFLNQPDKTVSDILGRWVDAGDSTKLPFCWLGILGLLTQDGLSDQDGVRLTLAKGMKPFVMAMMDEKRELFQSNLIWHLCLSSFFDIARGIMMSKGAFWGMISYEGFLPFVAQASCWSQSREDIKKECRMLRHRHPLESSVCPGPKSLAGRHAQRVIATILIVHGDDKSAEMRRALDQIACAPLCGNDPNCTDSTIVGFVRMLNEKSDGKSDGTDHQLLFHFIVKLLLVKHGYVDKRVIAELIEYGKGNSSMEAAATVIRTMASILGLDQDHDHIQLTDSRYAAAIRHGLLEFCIDALISYGGESNCGSAAWSFFLVDGLHRMAMHSKTARALRVRQEGIVVALCALRKKCTSQFDEECNAICRLIDGAIDLSAPATCCNCLEEVDRKDLLYCKRCGVECYCSPACQSESYALGHDELCKEEVAFVDWLGEEGLSETKLKRLEVLKCNLMMNGCRIMRRKAAEILGKYGNAAEVGIKFAEYPPEIGVLRSEEDDSESSDTLKCRFRAPVYYGFAEKADLKDIVVHTSISKRSLALANEPRKLGNFGVQR